MAMHGHPFSSLNAEKRVPENYIFPPEIRPGQLVVPAGKANIPIVDFHHIENNNFHHHLIKAAHDFGLFQVINHGVSETLMKETMEVFEQVFDLPNEEKSKINMKEDKNGICRMYTSSYNYETEETHYWRNVLRHSCSPLEDCIKYWPQKPDKYRETIGEFVKELKNLGSRMLELIAQGLGLEPGYFKGDLSEGDLLTVNQYPPCPDPTLTLGLTKHTDPNLLTILLQAQVPGLQVFKDGQWLSVDPLPNSFVIIVANQLEVVSNRKLKSGVHRAVTNIREARISAAFFISPSKECIIEPAKPLVQAPNSCPVFKAFQYKDFFSAHIAPTTKDAVEGVLEAFKIQ